MLDAMQAFAANSFIASFMASSIASVAASVIALVCVGFAPTAAAAGDSQDDRSVPSIETEYKSWRQYTRGMRHKEKALEYEAKAAKQKSENARAKLEAKARKSYAKAADRQTAAVKLDNQNYKAFNELGFALRKTGELQKAVGAYRYALQLNPKYHEAWEYLGEAFLALGILEEAKKTYMVLFNGDRERADQLMGAIDVWIDERGTELTAEEVEFIQWVDARKRLAKISRDLSFNNTRSW